MLDFKDMRGVVLGVANSRSIAYAVSSLLSSLGAELALGYGPDPKGRFKRFVEGIAEEDSNVTHTFAIDVSSEEALQECFTGLDTHWSAGYDFVVHSIAYASRDALEAPFSLSSAADWSKAQHISAYSIIPIARLAENAFNKRERGSLISMSFIGSALAVPNYNMMGPAKAALESANRYLAREYGQKNIRCNVISAGAIKTLSSSGIKAIGEMLRIAGEHSAMERQVTKEEVAATTAFLAHPSSSGITGQTIYVDCGYSIMAN